MKLEKELERMENKKLNIKKELGLPIETE